MMTLISKEKKDRQLKPLRSLFNWRSVSVSVRPLRYAHGVQPTTSGEVWGSRNLGAPGPRELLASMHG